MTERAKIIGLARKYHSKSLSQHGYGSSMYALTDSAIVALYKLAQSEAYEKAAKLVDDMEVEETNYCMQTFEEGKRFQCNAVIEIRKLKEQS